MYQLDGTASFDEGSNTVMFYSTSTTFAVWAGEYQGECTKMFLKELTDFLVEPLCVRSIGHEGARYMPDAWQWIARPDGTVTHESLSFQRD